MRGGERMGVAMRQNASVREVVVYENRYHCLKD